MLFQVNNGRMNIEDLETFNKIIFDSQSHLLEKIRHHNCEIENIKLNYEKSIQDLNHKLQNAYDEINIVYSSPRYQVGRICLMPFSLIKKLIRKTNLN